MIKNNKNQDIFYGYEYDALSLDKVLTAYILSFNSINFTFGSKGLGQSFIDRYLAGSINCMNWMLSAEPYDI